MSGALYGCEILCLLIREEDRLRVLRKVFGSKREEVTGDLRKLYNKECHEVQSSPKIILVIKSKGMRQAEHVAHMER